MHLRCFCLCENVCHIVLLYAEACFEAGITSLAGTQFFFPQGDFLYLVTGFLCTSNKFITEQI